MSIPALILVAHGSPDPTWARPLEGLRDRCARVLGAEQVGLAFLSYGPSVSEAVEQLAAAGVRRVVVVAALFSAGGRHVREDIPNAVELARREHPSVDIRLIEGALGEEPAVLDVLAATALGYLDARRE